MKNRSRHLKGAVVCLGSVLATAVVFAVEATTLRVSPETADAAFAALSSGNIPSGRVEVVLADGTYKLSKQLRLQDRDFSQAPLVIRAEHPGKAHLTGVIRIPAARFAVPSAERLARLSPEARKFVRCVNVRELGAGIPKRIRDAEFKSHEFPFPECYTDGKTLELSTWPDDGWAKVATFVNAGDEPRHGVKGKGLPVFGYAEDRPSAWCVNEGVFLHGYWCYDWYDGVLPVKSIDAAKKEITLAAPHLYSVKVGVKDRPNRTWRAMNLFDEISRPGECAFDLATGVLYFWPWNGAETRELQINADTVPFFGLRGVKGVTFEGLRFEYADHEVIYAKGCDGLTISKCSFEWLKNRAIRIFDSYRVKIVGCDFHGTGAGSIWMEVGDRKNLVSGDSLIEDCRFWDFSRNLGRMGCAIDGWGMGIRMSHNLFYDGPHIAVWMRGNEHVFEYNVVTNVCNGVGDAAAFYMGRNPTDRRTVIRHNYWSDIKGSCVIYFDDGEGDARIYGNFFSHCVGEGVNGVNGGQIHSHGGHDIQATGNVFVDCTHPLSNASWSNSTWDDMWRKRGYIEKLKKEVDVHSPAWLARYPECAVFLTPACTNSPRLNYSSGNVFVGCREICNRNWRTNAFDLVYSADPGFKDAAKGDYVLKDDSDVFRRNPLFEQLRFEEMGLLTKSGRPLD